MSPTFAMDVNLVVIVLGTLPYKNNYPVTTRCLLTVVNSSIVKVFADFSPFKVIVNCFSNGCV